MMDNKRGYRRIESKLPLYYTGIDKSSYDYYKNMVDQQTGHGDSFEFVMSLHNLDTTYGSLNKSFVLMMKEMDTKLNYIIDLLRNKDSRDKFKMLKNVTTCDISASGISFESSENLNKEDFVYGIFSLPIAEHIEIHFVGKITEKSRIKDGNICYGMNFLEIDKNYVELIIRYTLFIERKMIKRKRSE